MNNSLGDAKDQAPLLITDSRDFNTEDVKRSTDWEQISVCLQMGLTVIVQCNQEDGQPVKITLWSAFKSKEIANNYATRLSMGSDESTWVDIICSEHSLV